MITAFSWLLLLTGHPPAFDVVDWKYIRFEESHARPVLMRSFATRPLAVEQPWPPTTAVVVENGDVRLILRMLLKFASTAYRNPSGPMAIARRSLKFTP